MARRINIDMFDRLKRGEAPVPYAVIETTGGYRAYGEKQLNFTITTPASVIEQTGRIESFGSFERAIQNKTQNVLSAFINKTITRGSITLSNHDGYFSRMIPVEQMLSKSLFLFLGFYDVIQANHLQLFKGKITTIEINNINFFTVFAYES